MSVDAYCHVGLPRFGSLANAVAVAKLFGIKQSVLVLGPAVPDYETLFRAISQHPDRIRGIGIPFGQNERQQIEIAEIQVRAGLMGLRLSGTEILAYPIVTELLGLTGRWIYAVSIINDPLAVEELIQWLDNYPSCRVAAPHFLRPDTDTIESPLSDLIRHPRFHPIFSRQGGLGSRHAYPHTDLKPWIESVVSLCGWDSTMFGSEYPVIYWRDETVQSCLDWVHEIGVEASTEDITGFLGETASKLLFSRPGPEREPVEIPDWVDDQFDRSRKISLFEPDTIETEMSDFPKQLDAYVKRLATDQLLSFKTFYTTDVDPDRSVI